MAAPLVEPPRLSVVIPALNEAPVIGRLLRPLQVWRTHGVELILVDGGSDDETVPHAEPLVDIVLDSAPGRARQMNAGAAVASAPVLWFLHADSLPEDAQLGKLLSQADAGWGRFDIRLSGSEPLFSVIGALINLRSRLTGIATGDQGIFVARDLFQRVGGFPGQPLMEDVALSARLKREIGRPRCLRPPLVTDSRRWEQQGVWRTVWLMWRLRWRYWRGESPDRLHAIYYGGEGHE